MESSRLFKFVVEDIHDGKAVLRFDDEQTLTVDLEDLRGDIQVNDVLFAVFTEKEKETAHVRDMAKEVLNEILEGDDD